MSRVDLDVAGTATQSLDRETDSWKERPGVVFLCALAVRVVIAAIFLGSCDTLNAIAVIPTAAAHGYFYLPYFPVIDNILGSSALVISKLHFVPILSYPSSSPVLPTASSRSGSSRTIDSRGPFVDARPGFTSFVPYPSYSSVFRVNGTRCGFSPWFRRWPWPI